jgi:hypothetical protein
LRSGHLAIVIGLTAVLHHQHDRDDDADDREAGDGEHPRRALLGDLGAAQLHLLLEALLLERCLRALPLAGLGRLDAHSRFAFGVLAGGLDGELAGALLANLGLLRLAPHALRFLAGTDALLFSTAYRVLFFLDAVLLDLPKLTQREQHRIFALLGLGSHGTSLSSPPRVDRGTFDQYHAGSGAATRCCATLPTGPHGLRRSP